MGHSMVVNDAVVTTRAISYPKPFFRVEDRYATHGWVAMASKRSFSSKLIPMIRLSAVIS